MFSRLHALFSTTVRKTTTHVAFASRGHDTSTLRYKLTVICTALGLAGANFVLADTPADLGPASSPDVGQHYGGRDQPSRASYRYLICGGGVAAQEALRVIIEEGGEEEGAHVLLVSPEWRQLEDAPPRQLDDVRRPCEDATQTSSGERGFATRMRMFRRSLAALSWSSLLSQRPEVVIGPAVMSVDPCARIATLNNGTRVAFEKCLVAVGSAPPPVPVGKIVSRDARALVGAAQSHADWQCIHGVIRNSTGITGVGASDPAARPHFTVVGGGWMSVIVGQTLVKHGADVTFSYADPSFLARCLPKYIARDVHARLVWLAGDSNGIDLLSYSVLRYIVARPPLKPYISSSAPSSTSSIEAEVHTGTVFDAFSIIDFRTDRVLFTPTLAPAGGGSEGEIKIEGISRRDGVYRTNGELMAASDVYVAGAAAATYVDGARVHCGGDRGGDDDARGLRWSAEYARTTGRHAARNMLGARRPYSEAARATVDLRTLGLSVSVIGDVNGSHESFGYFVRGRERGSRTCGGVLEHGVLFCVRAAPPRFRGASQQLVITGVALWDGVAAADAFGNMSQAQDAAMALIDRPPLSRHDLEAAMDNFVMEHARIFLFEDEDSLPPYQDDNEKHDEQDDNPANDGEAKINSGLAVEPPIATDVDSGADGVSKEAVEGEATQNTDKGKQLLKPLSTLRRPSPRVIWRRHQSARTVPLRDDELLWVADDWVGAASPAMYVDKKTQAYADLLKRSAGLPSGS